MKKLYLAAIVLFLSYAVASASPDPTATETSNTITATAAPVPYANENLKIILKKDSVITCTYIGQRNGKLFLEKKDGNALMLAIVDISYIFDADSGQQLSFGSQTGNTTTPAQNQQPANPVKKKPVVPNEKLKVIMKNGTIIYCVFTGIKNGQAFLEEPDGTALILDETDFQIIYDQDSGQVVDLFENPENLASGWKEDNKNNPEGNKGENENQPKTKEKTIPPKPKIPTVAWTPSFHWGIEFGSTGLAMGSVNNWLQDNLTGINYLYATTGLGTLTNIFSGYYFALNTDYCFLPLLAFSIRTEYINSFPSQGVIKYQSTTVFLGQVNYNTDSMSLGCSLIPFYIGLSLNPRFKIVDHDFSFKIGYFLGYGFGNLSSTDGGAATGGSLATEGLIGFTFDFIGFNFGYRYCNIPSLSYNGQVLTSELTGNVISADFSGMFGGFVLSF